MMVSLLFIIGLMGLFFYNKIGSIIPAVDLPTTNIIELIILAGSFGVDKAEWQTGVTPCQMRQMCRAYWKRALRLMV